MAEVSEEGLGSKWAVVPVIVVVVLLDREDKSLYPSNFLESERLK